MDLTLAPGVSARSFDLALKAFEAALGSDAVFAADQDRDAYSDKFAVDETRHHAAAAVAPASATEVQAVVRIANHFKIPLWPISRGKNLGYGYSAPRLTGSVVVDLSRMKHIEMDVDNALVCLEPGVGFYDLYDYLQSNDLPFWISVPGNSWGSVIGNALERGNGYTPYGDHVAKLCGLEIVLPNGELVRTGTGAMASSVTWGLYQYGFGPSWDGMFAQSNLGIVTKANLWLMPAPEQVRGLDVEMDRAEDLAPLIDVLVTLRREGVLQHQASVGSFLRVASALSTRDRWVAPGAPLTDDAITAMRKEYGIGWWGVSLRVYGRERLTDAAFSIVQEAIASIGPMTSKPFRWRRGEAIPPGQGLMLGVPLTWPMQNANWYGGRGGHIYFSPVMPQSGKLALEYFKSNYARYCEFNIDPTISFVVGERHLTNPNGILLNKDDPQFLSRVDPFMRSLIAEAAKRGYSEYRSHLDYMDTIAGTFDFNAHALLRLNERIKNALDPNGIIAPGKNGIWPVAYDKERGR